MDLCSTIFLCISFLSVATLGVNAELCSPDGALRLIGFNSTLVGVVQVCHGGQWGTVCTGSSWGKRSSQVICRQLGSQDAIDFSTVERLSIVPDSGPIHFSVQCTGVEERLTDCSVQAPNARCSHSDDALVMCKQSIREGEVRLVGEGSPSEGIVELYSRQYGWATLCTTDWDDNDAQVACMQLGYTGGRSTTSRFTPRRGVLSRKRYNNFECSGSESSLLDCGFVGPFPHRCFTTSYAGVQCQENGGDVGIPLNIGILVLVTGIAFCLIAFFSIGLKCMVGRLRKKKADTVDSPRVQMNRDLSRIPRVRLDSDAWSNRQLGAFTTLAPPSYDDTILADRTVQAHAPPQQLLQDAPPVLPTARENMQDTPSVSPRDGANLLGTNASAPVTADKLNSTEESTQDNYSAEEVHSEMNIHCELEGNVATHHPPPSDTTGFSPRSTSDSSTHAPATAESQAVITSGGDLVEAEES